MLAVFTIRNDELEMSGHDMGGGGGGAEGSCNYFDDIFLLTEHSCIDSLGVTLKHIH